MIKKTAFFMLACAAIAQGAERTERISLDVKRPIKPFAIQLTEDRDALIEARIKSDGADFDPAGLWTAVLWYGIPDGAGVTVTQQTSRAGAIVWDMQASAFATNGRYSAQIAARHDETGRVEEWGRGDIIIRLNPGRQGLPMEWGSGWEDALNNLATVARTGEYGDLENAPDVSAEIAGAMAELHEVAKTGEYSDLESLPDIPGIVESGLETLADVAHSGDYADLTNTPTFSMSGGYASPYFWYPAWEEMPYTGGSATQLVGDVYVTLARASEIAPRKLLAKVDERETHQELSPPDVTWNIIRGEHSVITGNVLYPERPAEEIVVVEGTTEDHGAKRMNVPMTPNTALTVLANPAGEVEGTWRYNYVTNILTKFWEADVTATSRYNACWEPDPEKRAATEPSIVGPPYTFYARWFPDSMQLYENVARLPFAVNPSFFWPELADALRCVTAWRGDVYAEMCYVAIAPHYMIGVGHWIKSNYTNSWWCFDRDTNDFRWVPVDMTANEDRYRRGWIGQIADIAVIRIDPANEFPPDMIATFARPEVIRSLSPSMLDGTPAVYHNTHNLISLRHVATDWESKSKNFNKREWVIWASRDYANQTQAPIDYHPQAVHSPHVWDSGHPVFWFINNKIVMCGTFTYTWGGANAFLNNRILNELDAMIREDSGGAEGLTFLTAGDLQ